MSSRAGFDELNALSARLAGVSLVEANAGTGKTYSIVSLYLRLVLEATLTVDRILVVSFTDAATAELRERIRTRLRSLQNVFETGTGDDPDELALLADCRDRELGLRRIVRALQSFDIAAIYTIHGFCQRLLADAAFEAGLPLNTELITDDAALRRQIVDDCWHAEAATGSQLWVAYLLANARPDALSRQLSKYFNRPLLRLVGASEPEPSAGREEAFANAYHEARSMWQLAREDVAHILRTDPGLNRNAYRLPGGVDKLLAAADRWAAADRVSFRLLKKLGKLGSVALAAGTKNRFVPPTHPFFERMQALLDDLQPLESILSERLAAFRARLIETAHRELPLRKQRLRVRHFDDLLSEVYTALAGSQGAALTRAARAQYGAALIDEFQDTDPLQFAIFDQLFCHGEMPVFFVGDPKQAIYAFRGADVFAYLDARAAADRRYRLHHNYRSTQALIESVNALFGGGNPFVYDAIAYSPSQAARSKRGLLVDDIEQPAIRWWRVPSNDGRPLAANTAEKEIAEAVATDIGQLLAKTLSGRVHKPDREPLQAKDIAVLVTRHRQSRLVREALDRRGIGSVQRTDGNVFQTEEAGELQSVLRAVAEPGRHDLVRAALATDMLGFDAARIDLLGHDDRQWQQLLDLFAGYPLLWRQHGFARMYRRLARDFDIDRRLLRQTGGRRAVTNLAHLADLLQRESALRQGRLDEVLLWMRQQQAIEYPADQTMLLRLDSDENLVNIMTVHISKGLQFPVVYCPYLWTAGPKTSDIVAFHDDKNRASLDLGSTDLEHNAARCELEQLAESVRLAYVALTRAELSCTAVWGPINGAHRSGLNWLLHAAMPEPVDLSRLVLPGDAEISARLADLVNSSVVSKPMPDPATVKSGAAADSARALTARKLRRAVPRGWQVSSFSALTRHAVEAPRDYDAGKSLDRSDVAEPAGIFAFPRGARAGRCMHALFENIAFDAGPDEIEPVAARVLRAHGFDAGHAGVLSQMAIDVLATDLSAGEAIRLRDVTPARRVSEMEFYFPTARLDANALRRALGGFGAGTPIGKRLELLDFRLHDGYLHGFIDLVFEAGGRYYLADYKSNWLGNEPADYRDTLLNRQIALHDYYLQYLIYSVALHRHLRRHLKSYDIERHFGGVFYLFVRGMHPDRGPRQGVFADRPDAVLMQRLDSLFGGEP